MIRSSSRSVHKLSALCRSFSSTPSCRSLITTTVTANAIRRFTADSTIGNRRQTDNFRSLVSLRSRFQVCGINAGRSFASEASRSTSKNASETRKDVTTVEDPFDAPTYNIPEKPMTFTEGASYSAVILVGLGIAAAAGYGVFKELIFEPKECKVFNKALRRIQDDSQGKNRLAYYWKAEIERPANESLTEFGKMMTVQFHIRGPHGAGRVFTEMFKDKEDKQWKFMYLQVEIHSPSPSRMLLESYLPA
ncbi:hypothetical protein L1987_73176 [Smallanthus sonchifolius]|uniref:Uncharacterized protein n=1 Tax=Smallanthus sonchifolius TaxID=185202 RepID=A0ACB9A0H3_9ASTR|nr:hypothetical protein L1987_73176 [Smallanthus sonchifolius]